MEGEVGTLAAGVVAEVALAADTETQICTIKKGFDLTIKELNWGFANVVDAKAATGYLEVKLGSGNTPFRFPIGFGTGGATLQSNMKAGSLDVNIPVTKSESITIYATMNEDCVSAFAGIKFDRGKSGAVTYGDCNTAEDAAVSADTLSEVGTITLPPDKGGTIKKILVSYANVVNAKAASGYVELLFSGGGKGSQRYPCGGGGGGATNSNALMNAQEIPTNIDGVVANEVITCNIYLAEAAVNAHIGVLWV